MDLLTLPFKGRARVGMGFSSEDKKQGASNDSGNQQVHDT